MAERPDPRVDHFAAKIVDLSDRLSEVERERDELRTVLTEGDDPRSKGAWYRELTPEQQRDVLGHARDSTVRHADKACAQLSEARAKNERLRANFTRLLQAVREHERIRNGWVEANDSDYYEEDRALYSTASEIEREMR